MKEELSFTRTYLGNNPSASGETFAYKKQTPKAFLHCVSRFKLAFRLFRWGGNSTC